MSVIVKYLIAIPIIWLIEGIKMYLHDINSCCVFIFENDVGICLCSFVIPSLSLWQDVNNTLATSAILICAMLTCLT